MFSLFIWSILLLFDIIINVKHLATLFWKLLNNKVITFIISTSRSRKTENEMQMDIFHENLDLGIVAMLPYFCF